MIPGEKDSAVPEAQKKELAAFLRRRRSSIRPDQLRLNGTGRRRTSGLRREEVAWLAGISVDYYARLEQARGPQPSATVLAALARTLGLSDDERAYLFRLGGAGEEPPVAPCRDVPVGILRLLDRLDDIPAYVLDATYDVLAWNPLAEVVIARFSDRPPERRNGVRALFIEPADRGRLHPDDWEGVARATVADLRATAARYPDDPGVHALMEELLAQSPRFARFWFDHEVAVRSSGRYRLLHPVAGLLELDYEVLHLPDRDQRLMLYTAEPGSPSFERLRELGSTIPAEAAVQAQTA
ncbi:MAG: helix-turn-helix domain-containing protein [Acidimicrobiales bacterium]|nr:helix-turn-helix domain-containing protein [Acidimicrobiales bacterium]